MILGEDLKISGHWPFITEEECSSDEKTSLKKYSTIFDGQFTATCYYVSDSVRLSNIRLKRIRKKAKLELLKSAEKIGFEKYKNSDLCTFISVKTEKVAEI